MAEPAQRRRPGPSADAPETAAPLRTPQFGPFVARVLIVALVVAVAYLLWRAAHVLLLLFAAALLAVLFRTAARKLHAATRLPQPAAFTVVVLAIVAALAAIAWLFGAQIAGQFSELGQSIPEVLGAIEERLGGHPLGRLLLEQMRGAESAASGVLAGLGRSFGSTLGVVADLLLVFFAALYMAAQPRHYAKGLLELVPPSRRARIGKVLEALGHALWLWIKGKVATMAVVGAVMTTGLLLLDVPSALALGLIAAFAELVPFLGPVLAAVPAVLLVALEDPGRAVYVILLYLVVQQLESYVILPLIQKKAVSLPPVLTLAAILAFGVLFGPLGILLAEALAVTGLVVVKMLYVEETLGEHTRVPGRDGEG